MAKRKRCVAPQSSFKKSEEKITLFKVPLEDPVLLELWRKAIRINKEFPKICAKYFAASDALYEKTMHTKDKEKVIVLLRVKTIVFSNIYVVYFLIAVSNHILNIGYYSSKISCVQVSFRRFLSKIGHIL